MTYRKRLTGAVLALALLAVPATAGAAATAVGLGTAGSFAVLAGQTVTNTGPTVVTGDLGVSPGSAVTGFPPGIVDGAIHAADAAAAQAQDDLVTAYNNTSGQSSDASVSGDVGGQTFVPGVYNRSSSLQLTGTVTLDAQGDPDALWVFQAGSTLTTASNSHVVLVNGAQACHVFWQVGSSATLGTNSVFVGTVIALTSITVTTGATIDGRVLARNGAVTLDSNVITRSDCTAVAPSAAPSVASSAAPSTGSSAAPSTASAAGPSATAAPRVGSSQPPRIQITQPPTDATGTADVPRADASAALPVLAVLIALGGLALVAPVKRRRQGSASR